MLVDDQRKAPDPMSDDTDPQYYEPEEDVDISEPEEEGDISEVDEQEDEENTQDHFIFEELQQLTEEYEDHLRARELAQQEEWERRFTRQAADEERDRSIYLKYNISVLYDVLRRPLSNGHAWRVGDYCVTQLYIREVYMLLTCPCTMLGKPPV